MSPVRLILVGAGSRGAVYADHIRAHPHLARIVAVAEPRDHHRERVAREHGLSGDAVVADWRALADRPRLADAAIIATPDAIHVGPAVALADRGYHLLLEKPMAPDAAGCRAIVDAVARAGV